MSVNTLTINNKCFRFVFRGAPESPSTPGGDQVDGLPPALYEVTIHIRYDYQARLKNTHFWNWSLSKIMFFGIIETVRQKIGAPNLYWSITCLDLALRVWLWSAHNPAASGRIIHCSKIWLTNVPRSERVRDRFLSEVGNVSPLSRCVVVTCQFFLALEKWSFVVTACFKSSSRWILLLEEIMRFVLPQIVWLRT